MHAGLHHAGLTDTQRAKRTRQALEQHFRPEFLNRFQHIVVFHPLDPQQVQSVARQELQRVLQREGITGRNLAVDVDDAVIARIKFPDGGSCRCG